MRHVFKLFKMLGVWVVDDQFFKPFDLSKPNFILSFKKAYEPIILLALVNFLSSSKITDLGLCERAFRRDLMGLRKRRLSGFGINIECVRSYDQRPYLHNETKGGICIKIEFNP